MTESKERLTSVRNILLAGVGGQGILLASRIISNVALMSGFDVKSTDVHGMAQRGGSVTSQIRFGEKVFSPLISSGDIEYLVALEKLEALRYAHLTKSSAKVFINDQCIKPVSVSMGVAAYPDNIDELLRESYDNPLLIDCIHIARELGNTKVSNTILLGALSIHLPFAQEIWETVMKSLIKSHFIEINLAAFQQGQEIARNA